MCVVNSMEICCPEKIISKNYELHFESKAGYLHACVRGTSTRLKESLERWQQIAAQCNQRGFCKVLIEEDLKGQITFAELHGFAERLPKLGFTQIKVAFIDRYLDQHTANQFAETVAINRGIDVKIFLDLTEAEQWLLS